MGIIRCEKFSAHLVEKGTFFKIFYDDKYRFHIKMRNGEEIYTMGAEDVDLILKFNKDFENLLYMMRLRFADINKILLDKVNNPEFLY